MGTNRLAIKEIGCEEAINIDLTHKAPGSVTKSRSMLDRVKHLLGKVVTVDEDWIFKSKDWPYLSTKK